MDFVLITQLVPYVAAFFMIFGGVVPYIPQYLEIKKSKSAEGFSTFVCLALLLANILRIFFWFGRHFELPLLLQSIFMVCAMLVMIQLCVSVKSVEIVPTKERHFLDFEKAYFWRWTDFTSYLQFTVVFTALTGFLTYSLLDLTFYVEILGFLSVFLEAMLAMPQFLKNYEKKSTIGMSLAMVAMWTSGDIFKTTYFVLRHAPLQFTICGVLQISIDIAVFCQYLYYDKFYPLHVV